MANLEYWNGLEWFNLDRDVSFPALTGSDGFLGGAGNRPIAHNFMPLFVNPLFTGVEGMSFPTGTTEQRRSVFSIPEFRFNTTLGVIEYGTSSNNWTSMADANVTSITAGNGLTGGTITTSGAITLGGITLSGDVTGTAVIGATSTSIATSFADNLIIGGTGSMTLPIGTTEQRPSSPNSGAFRYNSTLNAPEFYNGSAWIPYSEDFPPNLTSVTAGNGLTGGTITTSGTVALGGITFTGTLTGSSSNIGRSTTSFFLSLSNPQDFTGTEGITLPRGTTAQRPDSSSDLTFSAGVFRFNTTTNNPEYWNGSAWINTAGAGTVTSITVGRGLTGDTITTTGTITLGGISFTGDLTGTATVGANSTNIDLNFKRNVLLARGRMSTAQAARFASQSRPANPIVDTLIYNGSSNIVGAFEFYDGSNWFILDE